MGGARAAQPALVNGAVGVVVAPRGRLLMVLVFTISEEKIVEIDAVANPSASANSSWRSSTTDPYQATSVSARVSRGGSGSIRYCVGDE